MAIAAPVAAQLARQLAPKVAGTLAPQLAAQLGKLPAGQQQEIRSKVRRIGESFASQFGLTGEAEYIGWKLLGILAWELWELKLRAPMQTAYHIEMQLVGLIDQAFHFLGGTGTALNAGVSSLEKAVASLGSDVAAGSEWVVQHL